MFCMFFSAPFHLKCPNPTVEAEDDTTVILLCFAEPKTDISQMTVEWVVNQTNDVHLYRQREDQFGEQEEHYRSRTSLSHKNLSSGNCSLSLRVKMSHGGTYMCSVRTGYEAPNCSINLTGKYPKDHIILHQAFSTKHVHKLPQRKQKVVHTVNIVISCLLFDKFS